MLEPLYQHDQPGLTPQYPDSPHGTGNTLRVLLGRCSLQYNDASMPLHSGCLSLSEGMSLTDHLDAELVEAVSMQFLREYSDKVAPYAPAPHGASEELSLSAQRHSPGVQGSHPGGKHRNSRRGNRRTIRGLVSRESVAALQERISSRLAFI